MSSDTTTAVSLLAKLTAGEISSLEVVRQLLDRSDQLKRLNAFVYLDPEQVLAQAREIDRRRQAGELVGPLAGVPVAIKDVLCVEGEPTTCGSRMSRISAAIRSHSDWKAACLRCNHLWQDQYG